MATQKMAEHYSAAELAELLFIKDGRLFWIKGRGQRPPGTRAENFNKYGYGYVCYKRKSMLSHRIVWLLNYGEWPKNQVDHINGDRADNRIENLRICTVSENQMNAKPRGNRKLKGGTLLPSGRYMTYCGGKYIGVYPTAEDAARAYDAAAIKMFGSFARLNFPQEAL